MVRARAKHVFCVGLCETGSSALAEALGALGLEIHTDPPLDKMLAGQFPEVIDGADGLAGPSCAAMFRELDLAFPHSRFILTLRTSHDWLDAMSHRAHSVGFGDAPTRLYGLGGFDRAAMMATYELHKAAVLAHFVGREDDLLLMDPYAGEGWEVLCPFVGEKLPRRAFPRLEHRHVSGPLRLAA